MPEPAAWRRSAKTPRGGDRRTGPRSSHHERSLVVTRRVQGHQVVGAVESVSRVVAVHRHQSHARVALGSQAGDIAQAPAIVRGLATFLFQGVVELAHASPELVQLEGRPVRGHEGLDLDLAGLQAVPGEPGENAQLALDVGAGEILGRMRLGEASLEGEAQALAERNLFREGVENRVQSPREYPVELHQAIAGAAQIGEGLQHRQTGAGGRFVAQGSP